MNVRLSTTLSGLVAIGALTSAAQVVAQPPTEITVNDIEVSPENLTSTADGTVYFGSTAKGTIYRALPGAAQAEPWILASSHDLTNVLGVLADEPRGTLWVCSNAQGRPGGPTTGETTVRAFDLKTGAQKARYPVPGGGLCNDIAVAPDGTTYVTESFGGRILRLKPGADALEVWLADPQELAIVDGVSLLADGAVYVNTYFTGRLYRIPLRPDGSAGTLQRLQATIPMERPDGLRAVGPNTLLQAEGEGRLTQITIQGTRADVRVVRDGLTGATGVTLVGDQAFVLVDRLKAVAVPYRLGMDVAVTMPRSSAVEHPTYVSLVLDVSVDRPASEVWKRVGKYCDISEWMRVPCTISSGKDGELGTVRVVGGMAREVLVGRTALSYTYAMPVRDGRPYDLYHGTLEARPESATTSRLVYTLFFDNSILPSDTARQTDLERRRSMFTQALQNMKILAEGGTLPPASGPGGGRPQGRPSGAAGM